MIGGVLSGATGYIGMNVSVRANARVAEAARGGVAPGARRRLPRRRHHRHARRRPRAARRRRLLRPADHGRSTRRQKEAVDALIGLGFGGSLISVFARLGGGIFTKAADVGADLVGKVEAGIPEDDPRNPAVIADNVGDNVGDCAGMAADLFETYAVTAVAVMLLGVLTFQRGRRRSRCTRSCSAASRSSPRSSARSPCKSTTGNVERALYQGLVVSGLIAAVAFYPVTKWLMDGLSSRAAARRPERRRPVPLLARRHRRHRAAVPDHRLLHVDALRPGQEDRRGLADRPRDEHHLRASRRACRPRRCRRSCSCSASSPSWKLAGGGTIGIYGIGVAVMGQLSLTGLIVALDAFGPITDNAGGIAEMADLPEEVRNVTDPLDAVGNTTKAVTKGYAIGSAVLAAVVLFAGFKVELADEGRASELDLRDRRPGGPHGPAARRHDGLPVRRALDGGRRPRRRRASSRRCAASSARSRGSWRAPSSPTTRPASTSSPRPRSAR